MKNTSLFFKIALAGLAFSFTACSKGFQTPNSVLSGDNSGQSDSGNGSSSVTTPAPIDTIDIKGYSSGGDAEGALVIDFDKVAKVFIISVPIPLSGLSLNVNVSPPKYPDIQVYNYTDDAGMNRLAVRIPAKYVLRGISLGTPTTLPNGQVIPFIGGELPSTSIDLNISEKSKAYLYVGSGAIAVYVSHPAIPSYASIYYSIRNKAKTKVIGSVGIAAKTSVGDGGFVVSVKLPAQLAKVIDDYIGSY